MSASCPYRCTGTTKRVRGADRRGRGADVDVVVALARVDEHGPRPCLGDGLDGCDERVRGNDRLVAGLEPRREHPEPQAVEAARDADADRRAAVGRECPLELGDRRAVREGARVDQVSERLEQLGPQVGVHEPEIDERHGRTHTRLFDSHRPTVTVIEAIRSVRRSPIAGVKRPISKYGG